MSRTVIDRATLCEFIAESRSYRWRSPWYGRLPVTNPFWQSFLLGPGISALIASIVIMLNPRWKLVPVFLLVLPMGLLCAFAVIRSIEKLNFRSNSAEYSKLVDHFHRLLFVEGVWLRVILAEATGSTMLKDELRRLRNNWETICKSMGLRPFPEYGYDMWLHRDFMPVAFGSALADALEREFGIAGPERDVP